MKPYTLKEIAELFDWDLLMVNEDEMEIQILKRLSYYNSEEQKTILRFFYGLTYWHKQKLKKLLEGGL